MQLRRHSGCCGCCCAPCCACCCCWAFCWRCLRCSSRSAAHALHTRLWSFQSAWEQAVPQYLYGGGGGGEPWLALIQRQLHWQACVLVLH